MRKKRGKQEERGTVKRKGKIKKIKVRGGDPQKRGEKRGESGHKGETGEGRVTTKERK